jgi:tetratricopeptide (TPR) repeat protein
LAVRRKTPHKMTQKHPMQVLCDASLRSRFLKIARKVSHMRSPGCSTAHSVLDASIFSPGRVTRSKPCRCASGLAVVAVLACLCSPVAFGQAGPTRVTDPSQIGQALAQPAYTAILDSVTPAQIDAALTYKPDAQVSARLRETLGASGGPALRTLLASPAFINAAQDGFGKLVGAYGYSSHNVADAAAGFLWFDWQLVHDVKLSEAQIRGVHRQVRALFMGSAELRSLPAASRQGLAEGIAYTAAMQMLSSNNAKDPAARVEVRRNAVATAKKVLGADLAGLDVTAGSGFVRKATTPSPGPAAAAPDPRPPAPAASPQPVADLAECTNADNKDSLGRLDACTRVISHPPADRNALVLAYVTRAGVYAQVREYDHVIADCDEVVRLGLPSLFLPPILGLRAGALTHKHEYDRALADFNAAIAAPGNPLLAEAYTLRGDLHLRMGHDAQALADVNKAIELKPGYAMAYAIRAQYRLEQNDSPGLLADANMCIRLDPDIADCHALRSQYYTLMGQFGAAQSGADRALALAPSGAFVRSVRGRLALAQGRHDVAISELNQAIDVEPLAPGAVASRGVAYERIGRTDLAVADYRRALELKPSSKSDRDSQETARQRLAALAAAPVSAAVPEAPPGRRIALVIGMTTYAAVLPLRNPRNDARAMAETFRRLGFAKVIEREDLTRAQLEEALEEFGDKAAGADWAVIYYAGHGVEMNGVNYLVPVDAKLVRAEDIEDEAVSLARVLAKAQPARGLRMVILDACRNNPFRMAPKAPRGDQDGGSRGGSANPPPAPTEGRSRGIGRGLAAVDPSGAGAVLVAFAARDGTTADDGVDHSPFTAALLAHLETPGLDIGILFRRVRDSVLARTNNVQEPYVYGSLPGQEFYFKAAGR